MYIRQKDSDYKQPYFYMVVGDLAIDFVDFAALEAKRAKYESIKQGMMQELLTGRTRLKGE